VKLLLIGPFPPPHGGISVHVREAERTLTDAGLEVRVLNATRGAPRSQHYLSYRNAAGLAWLVVRHACRGWIIHVHTNGHNRNSWIVSLICGLAGKLGPGSLLTLHSGMTASYLRSASRGRFASVRAICSLYDQVIAVNADIRAALVDIGVPSSRLEILPAYLASPPDSAIPLQVESFFRQHAPVCATVLFYRPEYGFDFLLDGLTDLRARYPRLGCIVMGDGKTANTARLAILKREIGDALLLTGDLPHEQCLAIMARCDVFLRCTVADGDAISVREALSAGRPVVATDVGYRPPGTFLFQSGDLTRFVEQVAHALAGSPGARPSVLPSKAVDTHPLLSLYRQYAAGGVE
jgi:glycogen synthase